MLLPKFDYHEPATIKEACQIMAEHGDKARLLAGGTDLIVHLKKGLISLDHMVYLSKISRLKEISETAGVIKIGSCCTMTQIAESELIQTKLKAVMKGVSAIGSVLVRNRATLGGNICNGSPAGDSLPSLISYGASVTLESLAGTRDVLLEDFFTGPGKTSIKSGEILSEILLPVPPEGSGADYIQLGKRKSTEINVVNVASYISLNKTNGTIDTARIALGSVGPTPLRAPVAEGVLKGETPSDALFAEAGERARRDDCKPINDFRGTADYRRAMIGVLTKRTLLSALKEAANQAKEQ